MDAYFKELTRRLNSAGIRTAPPEKDRLPILWNGEAVIFVSPSAHTWIQTENVLDDAAKEMYYKAADIAQEVREYVTAVEQAPPLKATGLDNEFRRLAKFNEVILAGRELPNDHGYQFVTWGWNESRNSLYHGHYYEDDYARAKEDFAARSGLVQKDKLFSDEQLTEVFRAVEETLESAYPLTTQRRELLERVYGQIKDSVPDLQERVMRPNEAEYAESMRLQEESQGVDEPDGVEIYWQDLTPAKQAEILRVFGENGNWDVIPIATLEVPDQTECHMSGQEGLILHGCGGDLQEWLDGINDLFTEEGILLDGTRFKDAAFFRHDGLTNLLLNFDGVKVNGGRLAVWRVNTHEVFGGTWLSDYVPNYLEGFTNVQHTVQKQEAQLSMQHLLDLAYSVDCCHVVDAQDDSQLGRFYVENDFVPETEGMPDVLFDLLDYEQIGRKMRTAEDGVFVQRSDDDPGGYVVRHSELKQAPPVPTEPPEKPVYTLRLNVPTLPLRQGEHGRQYEILDLPASEEQIQETARKVGAGSLNETMAAVLDGPLACLKADILVGEELHTINNLAQKIALLDAKGMLPQFKALQEATERTGLDQLMELTDQVDDYFFEPDKRSVEDVAMEDLQYTVGGKDSELMVKYMNLTGYGKALLERENGVVTHNGMLERKDGQPIQAQVEQEEQEPSQGGMEMM